MGAKKKPRSSEWPPPPRRLEARPRLRRPLGGLPLPSPAARLCRRPPGEGELEAAEKHPRLSARDAAVHTLPEKPLLH